MKTARSGNKPLDKSNKRQDPTNLPDTRPKHIPIEDLIEYKAKGLTVEDIAKLTGCTHGNVSQRLANADLQGLENYQKHKDKAFEHLQRRAVQNITDEELKNVSVPQRVWIAGVLQDKIQVMRWQATEIVDHRHLVVDFNKAYEQMLKMNAISKQGIEQNAQSIDITND